MQYIESIIWLFSWPVVIYLSYILIIRNIGKIQ